MDNITNLVDVAKVAIDDFEKYMFTNYIGKYIMIKEFSNAMRSRVSHVESIVRVDGVTNDNISDVKDKLDSVTNQLETIKKAFENGNNIELVIDESGNYIAQEIGEQVSLTNFTDYQPIQTSAVKITDYNPDEIVTPVVIEGIPDTNMESTNNIVREAEEIEMPISSSENFTEALDISAIDEFLNQSGIKENIGMPQEQSIKTL